MKKTFEYESDALSASSTTPTTAQQAATTTPAEHNTFPIPAASNGQPAFGHLNSSDTPPATSHSTVNQRPL